MGNLRREQHVFPLSRRLAVLAGGRYCLFVVRPSSGRLSTGPVVALLHLSSKLIEVLFISALLLTLLLILFDGTSTIQFP